MGAGAITQLGVAHQGNNDANYRTGATVTDRVLFQSEDLNYEFDRLADDALQGVAGEMEDAQGVKSAGGGLPIYVNYTYKSGTEFVSADTLLAAALGNATWDSSNNRNQITIVDDLVDYITALVDRDQSLWELIGAFIPGFSLSCSVNGRLTANFDSQAYDFTNSGIANTQSDIDALPKDNAIGSSGFILGHHMSFYIASDFTDALASGDKKRISGFNLNPSRNLTDNEYTTDDSTHTDQQKPILPVINGKREITCEIDIPRYDEDTYHSWKTNHTRLQALIEFVHPTTADELKIFMPNVVVENAPSPVQGAGVLSQTATLRLRRRNTAESVMTFEDGTNIDEEMAIETSNDRTAVIF